MRDVSKRLLVAGAVLLGGVATASAVREQQPELSATQGWVRLPATGQTTALAGAVVENTSAYVVYVTAAESDLAGRVELRDASARGPNSPPVKFLSVPAFASLTMDPKGPHLVLGNLKRALKPGEQVSLTLRTDQGIRILVSATVRK